MSNDYGVYECRGHWHVAVCGEEIAAKGDLRGDCFSTAEKAQAVADKLNRNPDDPTVRWATEDFRVWVEQVNGGTPRWKSSPIRRAFFSNIKRALAVLWGAR